MSWDTLISTLVGAIAAIGGGIAATSYSVRSARKIRMDEAIAERKIAANAEAYIRIKEVQSMLTQKLPQETFNYVFAHEEWWIRQRLFLPGEFTNKWLRIRTELSKLLRYSNDNTKTAEDRNTVDERLEKLVESAIGEIYEDMGLKRLVAE